MKGIAIVWLTVVLFAIFGWVNNIVKLVSHAGDLSTFGALEITRVIGIFVAPLGAVLGYF